MKTVIAVLVAFACGMAVGMSYNPRTKGKMMKKIDIQAIPHSSQRYETAGDYYETKDGLKIRVSLMDDPRYEFLIALHELVEAKLCEHRGVQIADIDAFDFAFEAGRMPGDTTEPGDDVNAPYFKEHQVATIIERLVAGELGVNWERYSQAVLALDQRPARRRK